MGLMDTIKGAMGGNTHEGTQADAQAAGARDQSNLTDRFGMGEGRNESLADQATQRIGDNTTTGVNPGKGEGFMSTRDERDTVGQSVGHHGEHNPVGHASGITGGQHTANHPTNLVGQHNQTAHSEGGITGAAAALHSAEARGANSGIGSGHQTSSTTGTGIGDIGSGHHSSGTGGGVTSGLTGSTGQSGRDNVSSQQLGSGQGHHHHHEDHMHNRDSGNSDGNLGMGSLGEQGLKQGHVGHGGRAGGFDGAGEGYADGNMGAGYEPFGDNSPISSGNKSGQNPATGSSGLGSSGQHHGLSGQHHGLSGRDTQSAEYASGARTGGDNYSGSGNQSGSFGADLTGAAGAGQRGAQRVAPGQFDESRNN